MYEGMIFRLGRQRFRVKELKADYVNDPPKYE